MFPVRDFPRFCAFCVIERANIAPGSTGIMFGFEDDVDMEEERFSSEEPEDLYEPEGDE